ncbi:hypothetical protein LJC27_00030 [Christensenellaceae bacterium OttesenSCG-928-M15]|nr:hypothetical protein [Christensenellaceae bacterium OttesenSCG-928-M15]
MPSVLETGNMPAKPFEQMQPVIMERADAAADRSFPVEKADPGALEDYQVAIAGPEEKPALSDPLKEILKNVQLGQVQEEECYTCATRRYVDGSNDSNVSFQTPTKIAPNMAKAKVMAHEKEHVVSERMRAQQSGRKVVAQSVTVSHAHCEECGKLYISGGQTRTVTKKQAETAYEQFAPLDKGCGYHK